MEGEWEDVVINWLGLFWYLFSFYYSLGYVSRVKYGRDEEVSFGFEDRRVFSIIIGGWF